MDVFTGIAGASALREYTRRKSRRERRIREAHPVVGGLILAVSDDTQSTRSWATGARGEELLGHRMTASSGSTFTCCTTVESRPPKPILITFRGPLRTCASISPRPPTSRSALPMTSTGSPRTSTTDRANAYSSRNRSRQSTNSCCNNHVNRPCFYPFSAPDDSPAT